MPWKDGYTISDERSLADDEVKWPDGRQCCFSVVVDLSLATRPQGLRPGDFKSPEAMFGLGEGLDLLRALLDDYGIRATFTVPAVMARMLQPTLRELHAAGHEIAANGYRHEDVSELAVETERQRLELTTAMIADAVGERPVGWFSLPRQGDPFALGTVSDDTMSLLQAAGYRYMGNGPADDIPHYWVTDVATGSAMLTMPYYYHFDDQFFLMFPRKGTGLEHADTLFANWRAEFDAQYKRGRHFSMTLHPYAVGWAHRIKLLGDFFAAVRQRPGVWNPTSGQCAAYWLQTYPAETVLRLEPSIWQDYPGSLS